MCKVVEVLVPWRYTYSIKVNVLVLVVFIFCTWLMVILCFVNHIQVSSDGA